MKLFVVCLLVLVAASTFAQAPTETAQVKGLEKFHPRKAPEPTELMLRPGDRLASHPGLTWLRWQNASLGENRQRYGRGSKSEPLRTEKYRHRACAKRGCRLRRCVLADAHCRYSGARAIRNQFANRRQGRR